MIEEKGGTVTLNVKLTVGLDFSPIERDGPITRQDFIENAIGCIAPEVFNLLEDELINVEIDRDSSTVVLDSGERMD